MVDQEKAMTDAINAITRLNFSQLLTLQASLSEHTYNVWQQMMLNQEQQKQKQH
jgi:hypothetical protein